MNQVKDTVLAFIDCINAHHVEGLAELMSDDHTFIDAHGNQVSGREKMTAGWRGYFEWFPDYYIEVNEVFEERDALESDEASRSCRGSRKWRDLRAVRFRRRLIQRKAERALETARRLESVCDKRSRNSLASLRRYQNSV